MYRSLIIELVQIAPFLNSRRSLPLSSASDSHPATILTQCSTINRSIVRLKIVRVVTYVSRTSLCQVSSGMSNKGPEGIDEIRAGKPGSGEK
jgi:hypothetical protein